MAFTHTAKENRGRVEAAGAVISPPRRTPDTVLHGSNSHTTCLTPRDQDKAREDEDCWVSRLVFARPVS